MNIVWAKNKDYKGEFIPFISYCLFIYKNELIQRPESLDSHVTNPSSHTSCASCTRIFTDLASILWMNNALFQKQFKWH